MAEYSLEDSSLSNISINEEDVLLLESILTQSDFHSAPLHTQQSRTEGTQYVGGDMALAFGANCNRQPALLPACAEHCDYDDQLTSVRPIEPFAPSQGPQGLPYYSAGYSCMTPPLEEYSVPQRAPCLQQCVVPGYPRTLYHNENERGYPLKQELPFRDWSCAEVSPSNESNTKHLLKKKICMKRPGLQPVYRKPQNEPLSEEVEERRKLRRERNKEAAHRCRIKKRAHVDAMLQDAELTFKENKLLKEKLDMLALENAKLHQVLKEHKSGCTSVDVWSKY